MRCNPGTRRSRWNRRWGRACRYARAGRASVDRLLAADRVQPQRRHAVKQRLARRQLVEMRRRHAAHPDLARSADRRAWSRDPNALPAWCRRAGKPCARRYRRPRSSDRSAAGCRPARDSASARGCRYGAGVGGSVSQQRTLRLRLAPQLFDDRGLVRGSDRHHRRLGALRHVADGSPRTFRRLGFGGRRRWRDRGNAEPARPATTCDFDASANFAASVRDLGASASFGASIGSFDGSTPCGAAAAKRSSNESDGPGGTVAGAEIAGGVRPCSNRAVGEP